MTDQELVELAFTMLDRSYVPYSHFPVGAALECADGTVFTGCNVENSSFGATICAERTAFVKAVSEGVREFEAIAIVSSEGTAWPCGICRQFMQEFCDADFKIVSGDDMEHLSVYTLEEILPEGFRL